MSIFKISKILLWLYWDRVLEKIGTKLCMILLEMLPLDVLLQVAVTLLMSFSLWYLCSCNNILCWICLFWCWCKTSKKITSILITLSKTFQIWLKNSKNAGSSSAKISKSTISKIIIWLISWLPWTNLLALAMTLTNKTKILLNNWKSRKKDKPHLL